MTITEPALWTRALTTGFNTPVRRTGITPVFFISRTVASASSPGVSERAAKPATVPFTAA